MNTPSRRFALDSNTKRKALGDGIRSGCVKQIRICGEDAHVF